MTWETVFQAITLIVGSLGGGSVIMIAVSKWGSDLLAAKVKADIEQKQKKEMAFYEKQLSDSKAKLNALLQNSSYITQYQYDLEMNIYKEVWKALFELISCKEWVEELKILNPKNFNISNENELKEKRKEHCSTLLKKLSDYQRIIDTNAPFYQKDLYETMQGIALEFHKIGDIFLKYQDEIRLADQDDTMSLKQISLNIERNKELLVEKLRNYLQSLKCIPEMVD